MNQLPGNKAVQGQIDRVPCPHCGKPNDFRVLKEQQLYDTGHCVFCDHCSRSMEITAIRQVELVAVRKDPSGKVAAAGRGPGGVRRAQQQQRPQIAAKPGFLQRLLGKG